MKKLMFLLAVFLALPMASFAVDASPRSVTVTTANTETVYLGLRGVQTRYEYASAYVTIICDQALTVTFDAVSDAGEFHAGEYASEYGGTSYDHYVVRGVPIVADEAQTFKVSAKSLTMSGVSVSGTMQITVEYEE